MLAFIDESGDPGMKNIGQSSSQYFAVTLVLFEDDDEALACDQRIELLKRELGFGPQFEFHFTKLKPIYRKAFLEAVAPYAFFYFSIVVNKAKLFGPGFKFPDPFYKYTCGLVFENTKPYLSNTIVVIDGSGDRKFRQQLQSYLKKRINDNADGKQYIKKVKMQDSRSNNLLQLADIVCGAVARCYSGKADAEEYRKVISHREIFVQFWPK